MRLFCAASPCVFVVLTLMAGCTTTSSSDTSRTGMEQLLLSNAVDQSLDKVDFQPFGQRRVFLDEGRLECTDKPYVVASIRHRLFHSGATIVKSAEEADVVLEPRSGGVGTDRMETFLGVPEIAMPGPIPVAIPEIQLWARKSQTATAKIGFVAYDPKTGRRFGQGGTALAKSDDNNWYFMGMGPLQNGSVRKELKRKLVREKSPVRPLPTQIAFGRGTTPTGPGDANAGRVQLTGSESETPIATPQTIRP